MRLRRRLTTTLVASATALAGLGVALNAVNAYAEPATDLMISVYIEGSGNNKAIELHNPTAEPLQLSDYTVRLYSNGTTSATNTLQLPAQELPAGSHFVIVHSQAGAELAALGDVTSAVTNYNGDDALTLSRGETVIDSMGQVGFRPTSPPAWVNEDGTVSMLDMTLTNTTCEIDADPDDAYDPSVNFSASAINDFSTLGTVNCSGVTPSPGPTPTETPTEGPGEVLAIGEVQGEGETSPYAGDVVTVEGTVTGNYQGGNGFTGFYLQDSGDDNPLTSDGIFVYAPGQSTFQEGESLRITGSVSEFFGQTQITAGSQGGIIEVLDTDITVEPTVVDLPVSDWERYEGMLLTFPQDLVIVEYFEYARYGEIVLATDRQYQPTHLIPQGPEAVELQAAQERHRIRIDDGRGNQNPSPAIHPDGQEFTLGHIFRGGDTLTDVTGVLSYRNNQYKMQPTQAEWFSATYEATNPREAMPDLSGDFHVASFNVLNYFTTMGSRGAVDADEFERQQQKIVSAIAEIDADVVGLIEIENNGTAVENLVTALNAHTGEETYAAINTGVLGSDEIVQAFIYQPSTTEPVGEWAAYDPGDNLNRPALTQTFRHRASGEDVTVSVNHLKSKGSACPEDADYDSEGAANCNLTRVQMAEDMVEWFDAHGFSDDRLLVMGDLNSYAMEDPINVFVEAGFTDFERHFQGTSAYGYVFDGRAGYLDYAMGNAAALADTVETTSWHINADEATLLDYQTRFKQPAEQALWAPDPYRSSDHDPVIVALQLGEDPEPSPSPTPTETISPEPTPTETVSPVPTAPPTRPGLPKTGT